MPTLEELWRAVFPTARLAHAVPDVGDEAGLERAVAWVRVLKARVPAFEALEADDLAILPEQALRALSTGPVDPGIVIDAVLKARGAGVILLGHDAGSPGAGESGTTLRTLAIQRAAACGLPAFLLEGADPAQLERSVIGYLVNARAELERQASRLESELERLALRDADLAEHAAAIGSFLGRAVALEGPRGEKLALHVPPDVPAAAAAAAGYLARPRRVALRTPLPVAPHQGGERPARRRSHGSLALLGAEPPSELERATSQRVAALLALELDRAELRHGRSPDRTAEPLPAAGPPWVSVVARQVPARAAVSLEERERVRLEVRRLAPPRRMALRGDATSLELRLVAAADAQDVRGLGLAERVAATIARPVAVSRPFSVADERGVAEAEARSTLEAVEALEGEEFSAGTGAELVFRADRLPAYRLVGALPGLPDGTRQARALLAPLLTGRASRDRERLLTLRAVLEHPALGDAAAALGVHRNTLAYRVRRIEQLTDWRLDDASLRFALSLAVRIVHNALKEGG